MKVWNRWALVIAIWLNVLIGITNLVEFFAFREWGEWVMISMNVLGVFVCRGALRRDRQTQASRKVADILKESINDHHS